MPDTLSRQEPEISKEGRVGMWIAILAIAVCVPPLFIVAWHYGIVTSATLILKDIIVSVRTMLHDMAAALKDLWQYIVTIAK